MRHSSPPGVHISRRRPAPVGSTRSGCKVTFSNGFKVTLASNELRWGSSNGFVNLIRCRSVFRPQQCLPRLQTIPVFDCSDVRCRLILAEQRQQSVHFFRCSSLFFAPARYTEVLGHVVFDPIMSQLVARTTTAKLHFQVRHVEFSPSNGWTCNKIVVSMTRDKFAAPGPVIEAPSTLGVARGAVSAGSGASPDSDIVRSSYWSSNILCKSVSGGSRSKDRWGQHTKMHTHTWRKNSELWP